jgi:internalin A
MAKKHVWTDVWGPLHVLNHAYEIRASGFTNATLADLKNCTSIGNLELSNSKEVIDLSLLAHIKDLRTLHLEKVKFINFPSLSATGLRSLYIDHCAFELGMADGFDRLETLTVLQKQFPEPAGDIHLPKLDSLEISKSDLSDLSFLNKFRNLRFLYLRDNNISDLAGISACPLLEQLDLSGNKIKDISLLSDFKELRYLKLYDTSVIDLRPLMKLENLRSLSVEPPVLTAAISE